MPANHGLGANDRQARSPVTQPRPYGQAKSCCSIDPTRLRAPFLEKRDLPAQDQVLGDNGLAWLEKEGSEPTGVGQQTQKQSHQQDHEMMMPQDLLATSRAPRPRIFAEHNLLHDRDSIFSGRLDQSIADFGLRVLKSPPRSPKANAVCERLIGTIRRECLDWLIPISENHLRAALKSWASHYNRGRPHMGLRPGIPDPPEHRILPKTPRVAGTNSPVSLAYASNRYSVASTMSTIGRRRAFDFLFCGPQ